VTSETNQLNRFFVRRFMGTTFLYYFSRCVICTPQLWCYVNFSWRGHNGRYEESWPGPGFTTGFPGRSISCQRSRLADWRPIAFLDVEHDYPPSGQDAHVTGCWSWLDLAARRFRARVVISRVRYRSHGLAGCCCQCQRFATLAEVLGGNALVRRQLYHAWLLKATAVAVTGCRRAKPLKC